VRFTGDTRPGLTQAFLTSEARYSLSPLLWHPFLGTVPSNECISTGLYRAIKADSGLRSSATYANQVPRRQNTVATKGAQQWRKTVFGEHHRNPNGYHLLKFGG